MSANSKSVLIAYCSQLVLVILLTVNASAQTITTVAGSNLRGDNGPATDANLYNPYGVVKDNNGNIYISEPATLTIRKADANGIITTIANRNGIENGQPTSTYLIFPHGLAIDGSGNLYIADSGNQRIRKIDTNGIATTVAGITGTAVGFAGDGGPATSAYFYNPNSVAVDGSGNLYIADQYNQRIRKVDTGGIITTVAGTGTAGFSGDGGAAIVAQLNNPVGVVVDRNGNVYIADQSNSRVRKIDVNGIISTAAGTGSTGFGGDGGLATNANLSYPTGVAVDGSGNLYIAGQYDQRIRKVDTGGIITTVAGTGTAGFSGDGGAATNATINAPTNVFIDNSGTLYFTDTGNQRVRKVSADGIISTVAGNGTDKYGGDGRAAINARLNSPEGVTNDGSGNLYISDYNNQRIRKVGSNGIISTVANIGGPRGLATDNNGNLYIAAGSRVYKRDPSGILTTIAGGGGGPDGFSGDGGPATNATLSLPQDVAIDASGNIYVVDRGNNRIRKIDTNGIITSLTSLYTPTAICIGSDNNLYVTTAQIYASNQVYKISPTGATTVIAGQANASFSGDGGLATKAGLDSPSGIAIDSYGNLYISDSGNNRIRRITTDGIITTVAGNGNTDFNGDGERAINATLGYPLDLTIDGSNRLYITDYNNNRIRQVTLGKFIVSIQNGNWLDAATWDCGCVPTLSDAVTISTEHKVTINQPVQVQSIKEKGNLVFDTNGKISF